MTRLPLQGNADELVAASLTDAALAQRIDMFVYKRRAFTKSEADAFLTEAARRLRWGGGPAVDWVVTIYAQDNPEYEVRATTVEAAIELAREEHSTNFGYWPNQPAIAKRKEAHS